MVSQHPDHASKPYWHKEEFINTQHEIHECFLAFSELGASEYMWDWEGKFVDESVIERLFGEYSEYFKKFRLGRDKFLTFRLPNPKAQTEFRLGRAFMGILGAAGLAQETGFHAPPLFEVILPMTESAGEILDVHEAFKEITSLKHPLYNLGKNNLAHIEVIPLFEQVSTILSSHKILKKYIELHQARFGFTPAYVRPFLARSDPALNSGLLPTVLAIKIALSRYLELEAETAVKFYPIIGCGSLPFRGGLTPETVERFCREYAGVRTAVLQGAFRYDFEKTKVVEAVRKIEKILPQAEATRISLLEARELSGLIKNFEMFYRQTIEEMAPLVNQVALHLPKRRERVLHIGLFGYSRGIGKVKLPRAIGFTAALYSLGIPPEIIATGRSIKYALSAGKIDLIEKFYGGLREDLKRAGRFLWKDGLEMLAQKSGAWKSVAEDVRQIELYLGERLGPLTPDEHKHAEIARELRQELDSGKSLTEYLEHLAVLRKSLG